MLLVAWADFLLVGRRRQQRGDFEPAPLSQPRKADNGNVNAVSRLESF